MKGITLKKNIGAEKLEMRQLYFAENVKVPLIFVRK